MYNGIYIYLLCLGGTKRGEEICAQNGDRQRSVGRSTENEMYVQEQSDVSTASRQTS